jgi:hypothetical protein
VKFTIEIYANGAGSESLLYREQLSSISLLGAREKARVALAEWHRRGARIARVLNTTADIVYKIGE